MPFHRSNSEAQIVQAAAIDVLAGALSRPGAKLHLAQVTGLKLPAISRILSGNHMPTLQTARRIASALPLPAGEQTYWLNLIASYWKLRREARSPATTNKDTFDKAAFDDLRWRHHYAQFNDHPQGLRVSFASVYDDALHMLTGLSAQMRPRAVAALCSILQDTSDLLGRGAEALLWAKRCRHVAELLSPQDYASDEQEFALDIQVNSIRIEAAMLHKVELNREAYALCEQARHTDGFARDRGYWDMQVTRDQLNALAKIPRFTLSEAEGLAVQARRAAECSSHEAIALLNMLLTCSLAQAYLAHGRPKLALRELAPFLTGWSSIPFAGPLHRVRFLSMWARTQSALNNPDQTILALDQADQIALSANLICELEEIAALRSNSA
jgi:transcriptional regulator with XRE-family HTH domain